jgi:hypothetical protein
MTRCLISVSEATLALAVSLRVGGEERLDSVIQRALAALNCEQHPGSPKTADEIAPVPRDEPSAITNSAMHSVTLFGNTTSLSTKQDVLTAVLCALSQRDQKFLERFAGERGRTRRFVSRSREALYPGSPHLASYARQLAGGWWMATNFSERDIERAVTRACEVAGVSYGRDVSIVFRRRNIQPPHQYSSIYRREHRV